MNGVSRPRWLRRVVFVALVVGLVFFVVLLDAIMFLPARADRRFKEVRLGDDKSRVEQLLGTPRRVAGPAELARYRSCERWDQQEPTEVLVFMKGIDRLYVVGLLDGRVVSKCTTAM